MKEKIANDLKDALKCQDKTKLNTLRSVKGAVQLEVINKKTEETDDLYLECISKQIKLRKDSILDFEKANRLDLVKSYQDEIDILTNYLPIQLTNDELNKIISDAFIEVKPTSMKDFGSIMRYITPLVKNRCDMKELSNLIKERLN